MTQIMTNPSQDDKKAAPSSPSPKNWLKRATAIGAAIAFTVAVAALAAQDPAETPVAEISTDVPESPLATMRNAADPLEVARDLTPVVSASVYETRPDSPIIEQPSSDDIWGTSGYDSNW